MTHEPFHPLEITRINMYSSRRVSGQLLLQSRSRLELIYVIYAVGRRLYA